MLGKDGKSPGFVRLLKGSTGGIKKFPGQHEFVLSAQHLLFWHERQFKKKRLEEEKILSKKIGHRKAGVSVTTREGREARGGDQ